jgi:hypothetical protein
MSEFAAAWERVVADQATQDRLDAWYKEDGREDPTHPMYSLYTGLAEKYKTPN